MLSWSELSEDSVISRRQLIGAAGAAAVGSVLVGCGTSSGGSGSKNIGFAMQEYKAPRYASVDKPVFSQAVRAAGYSPIVNQADNDQATWAQNVEDLITAGPKSIALMPPVSNAAARAVQDCVDAGVPCFAYNNAIPSGKIKGFVARNNVEVGEQLAKRAFKDTGLKGNWVIIGGQQGNSVADESVKGFMNIISPYVDNGTMNLIATYRQDNFSADIARTQTEQALTKTDNKVRGFLCMWDGGALGVLGALRAQGLADASKVWVSGQDANEDACRAIILGELTVSRFTRFDVMAKTGAKVAIELAQGKRLTSAATYDTGNGAVPFFPIPQFNVDKSNVISYLARYAKAYPGYLNVKRVFRGIPQDKWPAGADKLVGAKSS